MIVDPIKKVINPIAIVMTKLDEGLLSDKSKNAENNNKTISGLKRWFFNMLFLFKNPKKFSLGYNLLK